MLHQQRDIPSPGGHSRGQAQTPALLQNQDLLRALPKGVAGVGMEKAAEFQRTLILQIVEHEQSVPILNQKSRRGKIPVVLQAQTRGEANVWTIQPVQTPPDGIAPPDYRGFGKLQHLGQQLIRRGGDLEQHSLSVEQRQTGEQDKHPGGR